jgi:RNA polymerase sigma-70 factor (ECF subfamily)
VFATDESESMRLETAPDDDARLMLAFQRGDETCFEQLFQKYKKAVINFAFRFTGRAAVSEELAQEIFVKCYMARDAYQPSARFTTWLFRIARNHCLNEVRRQDYRHRTEPISEERPLPGGASPEAQAQARALERAVQQALAALPESQRTALVLCQLQGMSYEEIAATMETTVSAVKSLLNRARRALIKHLEVHHEM